MFDNLWALLIGIQKYDREPLYGPYADVQRMKEFLMQDLHVPSDNILIVQDARRHEIIGTFETHLINNTKILPGSSPAILFYYSGHGGRVACPPNWPAVLETAERDGKLVKKIEVLIPSDCTSIYDANGFPSIQTIPDRTINSLLLRAAQKHGDCITVILDCCFSGHLNRSLGGAEGNE
ncbi:hypothetical protein GYMLUDRAFT_196966, partial [Collybiopsis luxurians FD-317 M1]